MTAKDTRYKKGFEEVKGKLSKESCSNNTSIEYSYDGFGREIQKKENICGRVFTTSTNYDTKYNRINSLTYPSGLQIGYSYTNTGYQNRVFNIENGSTYWQANTVDANNRICSETSGNGIIRWTNYDNAGNITRIQINNLHANIVDIKNRKGSEILGNGIIRQTKNDNVGDITRIQIGNAIDYTYDYDSNNNLISKKDNIEGTGYSYRYDQLNRLEDVYKQDANNKSSVVDYMYYDESGNITYKYGIGNINYQYGTNRISSIENSDYSIPIWDDIKYTSFNKVSEVKYKFRSICGQ